jgi:hypothetical protein
MTLDVLISYIQNEVENGRSFQELKQLNVKKLSKQFKFKFDKSDIDLILYTLYKV